MAVSSFAGLVLLIIGTGTCYADDFTRISGGSQAAIVNHPSVVQVESYNVFTSVWTQSCGGCILNSNHVLSTARCFDGILYLNGNRRVRAGTGIRNTGGQTSQVDSVIRHPDYVNGYDADLAVVRIVDALTYNPVVQPGTIIAQGINIPVGTPVVAVGWGLTDAGSLASTNLQEVTVLTADTEECKRYYQSVSAPGVVTDGMICTGLDGTRGNACQGDYGGPLYFGDIIVGVLSWGDGCSDDGNLYPVVSTAIAAYSDWIVNVTNTPF